MEGGARLGLAAPAGGDFFDVMLKLSAISCLRFIGREVALNANDVGGSYRSARTVAGRREHRRHTTRTY